MNRYCYVNGKIVPADEAFISVFDLGLQRGYGVFDVVRTYKGKFFHFDDHIKRLRRSAVKLRLELPLTNEKIHEVADDLIRRWNFNSPLIKLFLTGGTSSEDKSETKSNFIMTTEEMQAYEKNLYTGGGRLITNEFQRELPEIKSTNYLNSLILEPLRKSRSAADVLYFSKDGFSECTRSNFFMLKKNILITPRLHILEGITRKIILNISKQIFHIEERNIFPYELDSADETFITSTSKGILPIVQIDNQKIGEGIVGPGTRKLSALFNEYVEEYYQIR